MTESAGASAAALDATVTTGTGPESSRLERAAAAWEWAVDRLARARRKVAKLEPQLADAQRVLSEAEATATEAAQEFEEAKAAIGDGS